MFLKGRSQSPKAPTLNCIQAEEELPTNSEQLCGAGLLSEKLWIIIKMHSLCLTPRVGSVAPPLLTDSTNESQLKRANLFPESLTH